MAQPGAFLASGGQVQSVHLLHGAHRYPLARGGRGPGASGSLPGDITVQYGTTLHCVVSLLRVGNNAPVLYYTVQYCTAQPKTLFVPFAWHPPFLLTAFHCLVSLMQWVPQSLRASLLRILVTKLLHCNILYCTILCCTAVYPVFSFAAVGAAELADVSARAGSGGGSHQPQAVALVL